MSSCTLKATPFWFDINNDRAFPRISKDLNLQTLSIGEWNGCDGRAWLLLNRVTMDSSSVFLFLREEGRAERVFLHACFHLLWKSAHAVSSGWALFGLDLQDPSTEGPIPILLLHRSHSGRALEILTGALKFSKLCQVPNKMKNEPCSVTGLLPKLFSERYTCQIA